MGVKFGMEIVPNFTPLPSVQGVAPAGEKPQNRPAMLPVKIWII